MKDSDLQFDRSCHVLFPMQRQTVTNGMTMRCMSHTMTGTSPSTMNLRRALWQNLP